MPTSSHHGSTLNDNSGTMSIMMTNTTSMEEQVDNLIKMVEELTKSSTEKDTQIASLTSKLENTAGKVPINTTTDLPKTQPKLKATFQWLSTVQSLLLNSKNSSKRLSKIKWRLRLSSLIHMLNYTHKELIC